MQKNRGSLSLVIRAITYSFSFCFKNAKKETIARIILSAVIACASYLSIQYNGYVLNSIQKTLTDSIGSSIQTEQILNSGVIRLLCILLLIVIINQVSARINWAFRSRWSQILRFKNLREVNDHKATLDVGMFKSKEYDDITKRIQELPASWSTRTSFAEGMFLLISLLFSFFAFGSALVFYKPIYALIVLIITIPLLITEFRIANNWWTLFEKQVPNSKRRSILERAYNSSIAFTQALMFNQMPTLRREIDINTNQVVSEYDGIRRKIVVSESLLNSLTLVCTYTLIGHAIWNTLITHGNIGTLTVIIAAIKTFQSSLEGIIYVFSEQWNDARGVVLIKEEFFGLKPHIKTEYPVVPDFEIIPEIKFKDVCFTYPGAEKKVLKNVNFSIQPGQKLAVVGKSGSGKSTLLNLLMRYYDPTEGTIYASGVPLKNIEPKIWSNICSALTQDFIIIERKVGEEIASSRLGFALDEKRMEEASSFAEFDYVAKDHSDGYLAQIGTENGGREFSGGEKQRLALARLRYRGTPVLILDEPDSKLDPDTAQKVMDNLFSIKDATIILITHHVSRAERCDNIILMDKGEILETGNHEELISMNGKYSEMYYADKERLSGKDI